MSFSKGLTCPPVLGEIETQLQDLDETPTIKHSTPNPEPYTQIWAGPKPVCRPVSLGLRVWLDSSSELETCTTQLASPEHAPCIPQTLSTLVRFYHMEAPALNLLALELEHLVSGAITIQIAPDLIGWRFRTGFRSLSL